MHVLDQIIYSCNVPCPGSLAAFSFSFAMYSRSACSSASKSTLQCESAAILVGMGGYTVRSKEVELLRKLSSVKEERVIDSRSSSNSLLHDCTQGDTEGYIFIKDCGCADKPCILNPSVSLCWLWPVLECSLPLPGSACRTSHDRLQDLGSKFVGSPCFFAAWFGLGMHVTGRQRVDRGNDTITPELSSIAEHMSRNVCCVCHTKSRRV